MKRILWILTLTFITLSFYYCGETKPEGESAEKGITKAAICESYLKVYNKSKTEYLKYIDLTKKAINENSERKTSQYKAEADKHYKAAMLTYKRAKEGECDWISGEKKLENPDDILVKSLPSLNVY